MMQQLSPTVSSTSAGLVAVAEKVRAAKLAGCLPVRQAERANVCLNMVPSRRSTERRRKSGDEVVVGGGGAVVASPGSRWWWVGLGGRASKLLG